MREKIKAFSKKYIYIFIPLFLFWLILAPSFEQTSLIAGLAAVLITIIFCRDILFDSHEMPLYSIRELLIFLNYIFPFLLLEIIKANIDVVKIVLHPKLPIQPAIIEVPIMIKNRVTQVIYANSVTLTPGTLSIDITKDTFVIHALTDKSAEGLKDCVIEKHTCKIDRLAAMLEKVDQGGTVQDDADQGGTVQDDADQGGTVQDDADQGGPDQNKTVKAKKAQDKADSKHIDINKKTGTGPNDTAGGH